MTKKLLGQPPATNPDAIRKVDLDAAIASVSSGALVDGGGPTTNHTGNFRIDFGSPT